MNSSSSDTARALLKPLEKDLVRLLQNLVRTDTVAIPPDGNETAGQLVLHAFLQEYGVDAELYEVASVRESGHPCRRTDRNYAGRKNLVARLAGTGKGRSLLFNGHMDTVPPGHGAWTESPFSGTLRDGKIFGRGSFDMKGGLAAQFLAVCALREAGIRPGGDLVCESVVDEEWAGGGGTLAARLRGDRADACVITEGTQLEVARATRGGAIIDLVSEAGDPSRYFSTAEVVSPALPLGRLLGWVDTLAEQRRRQVVPTGAYRDFSDPVPVQVLNVQAGCLDPDEPHTVPLSAIVRVYLQFLPQEDVPLVLHRVRASLVEFCSADPFFGKHPPAWRPRFDPPLLGHELPADHPWSRSFTASAAAALGATPAVTATPYPCDAFLVHREFGIPTLLFGPRGAGAHNADEYVEIDSVFQTATVLLTAALEWCGA